MKKIKFIPQDRFSELGGIAPKTALSLLPDWYKAIPPRHTKKKLFQPLNVEAHNHTVKRCVPFLDAMAAGYMAILDDDVYVEQIENEEGKTVPFFRWKTTAETVTIHSKPQYDGMPIPDGYEDMVAKWSNEWEINTPSGYSIFFTHPSNRFDLPFLTLSGFVDTDVYQLPVQFPFFLRKGFEGMIVAGTPVAQLIPVKRDNWQSEIMPMNPDESYIKKRNFLRTFADSYRTNVWQRKSYK